MSKKFIIGVVVVLTLGVGGYILYKRSKPSRKMFDEMVRNANQSGSDVFMNTTENYINNLFRGFQDLKISEAMFLIDFFKNLEANRKNKSQMDKFLSVFQKMKKYS